MQNKISQISLIGLIGLLMLVSPIAFAANTAILMSDGTIATDIKDIKPPLYFKKNLWLWVLAGIAAIFIIAGFATYALVRQRRARERILCPPAAYEAAYKALEDLKESGLLKKGLVKEYFFRLSFIVRQYLENQFNLRAPEMTTEEFLTAMKESQKLNKATKEMLKNFLEQSDMVKFAKYGPTADEILGAFDAAKKLVDETKETQATQ